MTENRVPLDRDKLESLFENETHHADILIKVFKMVFPDWDNIKSVGGFPRISQKTNKWFFDKFIKFDKVHHPKVLNGGLWMNNGFGTLYDEKGYPADIPDFVVDTSECKVVYNDANQ